MHESSFIFAAFRLLNFVILLVVLAAIYHRYIKPMLVQEMTDLETERLRLKKSLMQLTHTAEQHQHMRIMQKIEGEALLDRMQRWANKIREHQHAEMLERTHIAQQAAARRSQMLENFYKQTVLREAQILASHKAEDKLVAQFSDVSKQHDFIASGIKLINRE